MLSSIMKADFSIAFHRLCAHLPGTRLALTCFSNTLTSFTSSRGGFSRQTEVSGSTLNGECCSIIHRSYVSVSHRKYRNSLSDMIEVVVRCRPHLRDTLRVL